MNCGVQPVRDDAQPVSCSADRNACDRSGSPPASRFHCVASMPVTESKTEIVRSLIPVLPGVERRALV
jgi:hypothetical protein